MEEGSEGKTHAFVGYMQCVPLWTSWMTLWKVRFCRERHDVGEKTEDRDAVTADEWFGAIPL